LHLQKNYCNFAKEAPALEIKVGVIEKVKVSSVEEMNSLATLPISRWFTTCYYAVLQAPIRNTALLLKAVAESKEKSSLIKKIAPSTI